MVPRIKNSATHKRRHQSSLRDVRAHSALLIVFPFIDSVRAVLSERRYTAPGMRCSERDAAQRIRLQPMQRVGENHDGQAKHVILHGSMLSCTAAWPPVSSMETSAPWMNPSLLLYMLLCASTCSHALHVHMRRSAARMRPPAPTQGSSTGWDGVFVGGSYRYRGSGARSPGLMTRK